MGDKKTYDPRSYGTPSGYINPNYFNGGDSVCVVLTGVTDLEECDPVTGQALFQLTWEPPGQDVPHVSKAKRAVKSPYALGSA